MGKKKKKLRGKQLKKMKSKLRHREMMTLITGRSPIERNKKRGEHLRR